MERGRRNLKKYTWFLSEIGKANRTFIINIPDDINGACIFRGAPDIAIRLFNLVRVNDRILIFLNYIYKKDDAVKVTKKGDLFSVRLLNPKASFFNWGVNIESTYATEYYEISNFTGASFDLKFKDFDKDKDRVIYYSRGRMEAFEF